MHQSGGHLALWTDRRSCWTISGNSSGLARVPLGWSVSVHESDMRYTTGTWDLSIMVFSINIFEVCRIFIFSEMFEGCRDGDCTARALRAN